VAAHEPPNTVQAEDIFRQVEINPGAYLAGNRIGVLPAWEVAAVPAFKNMSGELISTQLKPSTGLVFSVEAVLVKS